ncbi:hypothetical protein PVK06_040545 [Gossypium arboreum]|uniref:Uncharacterized protein n=1 Tax=Gossypium arboreum TaxID=29729 RepID=A0ABR0N6J1_GOSAR|nr:hypothetical protein PVK06_040545 [Gossypium arboreum]
MTIYRARHHIHIRPILLIIRIFRAMTIYRACHRIHIRPILLIIRICQAMTIFQARQGADAITGLISLGRTNCRTALLSAHIHCIIALPLAPICCSTPLLLGCIYRSRALLPAQVHRCHSSHMIFLLCIRHPHLRLKMMLVVAITHNVNVDLRRNIPLGPHH